MDSFIVRVTAYHGDPVLVGNIPTRAGISFDAWVKDPVREPIDMDVNILLGIFERSHQCKVNFGDEIDTVKEGTKVYEFDVFEPSCATSTQAQQVISDLSTVMVDWSRGLPLL
jgi:hypothetical protein